MKRLIAILCMICFAGMTACAGAAPGAASPQSGPESPQSEAERSPSGSASLDPEEEAAKQAERAAQTLWSVLDGQGNEVKMLSEENEDVLEIEKIVNAHCAVVDNRDYTKLDPEEELQFYSADFVAFLKNGGYSDSLKKLYEENGLKLAASQIVWYRNYFNEDTTTCKVTVDSEFQLKEAKQEYLDQMKMEIGVIYQEPREYYFSKIDGKWTITNIKKGVLAKRASL